MLLFGVPSLQVAVEVLAVLVVLVLALAVVIAIRSQVRRMTRNKPRSLR